MVSGSVLDLFDRTGFAEKYAVEMFNNIGNIFQEGSL